MKFLLIAAVVFAVLFIGQRLLAGDVISPEDAARRVAAGTAILIDVREPGEWRDGVVTGALLLPLSDLSGERAKWKPVPRRQPRQGVHRLLPLRQPLGPSRSNPHRRKTQSRERRRFLRMEIRRSTRAHPLSTA